MGIRAEKLGANFLPGGALQRGGEKILLKFGGPTKLNVLFIQNFIFDGIKVIFKEKKLFRTHKNSSSFFFFLPPFPFPFFFPFFRLFDLLREGEEFV